MEDFRQALYDLLIMHNEISVQIIYSRLKPVFYELLQEIHGEKTENQPSGYRLFQRFPILKVDPPRAFISQCIDHFSRILRVEQMAEDIEHLIAAVDASTEGDEAAARLMQLIRDFQHQKELVNNLDLALAEEALTMKRVWSPTEWKVAA
jgi:DNA primase